MSNAATSATRLAASATARRDRVLAAVAWSFATAIATAAVAGWFGAAVEAATPEAVGRLGANPLTADGEFVAYVDAAVPLRSTAPIGCEAAAPPDDASETPSPTQAPPAELDYYAGFIATIRRHPTTAGAMAEQLLASEAPAAAKVAVLRALRQCRHPAASDLCATAVATIAQNDLPTGESVATFALRLLARDAAGDPAVREHLRRIAFAAPTIALPLRIRAATVAAATAVADERYLVAGLAVRQTAAEVRDAALAALAGPAVPAEAEPHQPE